MRTLILLCALMTPVAGQAETKAATPAAKPSTGPMSNPAFELFRLVPGQAEAFIRGVAIWDQVNAAGGQPKTQLYLHADGEGWDVMLYKPPRVPPTAEQQAAMAAKMKELGLVGGPMFFTMLRERVADHAHLVMTGPTLAENWVKELETQQKAYQAEYKGTKTPN